MNKHEINKRLKIKIDEIDEKNKKNLENLLSEKTKQQAHFYFLINFINTNNLWKNKQQ